MAASDPFDLVGDREVGVVCVHGFTGSPYGMRYLGEQLARDGATVHGGAPSRPGHGTSVDDLARVGWCDWTCALDRATDAALPQVTPPVRVVHARRDHTAPVACATRRTERTPRARARRLRILPRSFHLIAIDVERDIVAAEVIAFLARHAAGQLPGDLPCVT